MRFLLALILLLMPMDAWAGYVLLQGGDANTGLDFPDAQTNYYSVGGTADRVTTAAQANVKVRAYGGTFDKSAIQVSANDVSSASTVTFQLNSAATAISLSITGNTTGLFEDTSNTSTASAGDDVSWEVAVPSVSGNHSIIITNTYCRFSSSTNTVQRLVAFSSSDGLIGNANVRYFNFSGRLFAAGTVEADAQYKARTAGTIKKLYVYAAVGASSPGTVKTRINGGDGNITVSLTASTTGAFEDTSNTDNISSGDLITLHGARDSGTNNVVLSVASVELETTNKKSFLLTNTTPVSFSASTTYYLILSGGDLSTHTTEDNNSELKARFSSSITNIQIRLSANAATGNGTFDFRKNGASGNNTVSVTASTTGLFEDTTHSDSVAIDDLINYRFVVGSGGTSTVSMMGSMIEDTTGGGTTGSATIWLSDKERKSLING